MLISGCCFIYLGGLGRVVGRQAPSNLDHHQGNTALLLRTVSSYVSASALFFSPPQPAVIFYLLYFCDLTGQHHFGFLTAQRLKYTRVASSCVFGVWLTEFAEFIFTSCGKRYECLRCHCPLTRPTGRKGFLTHPSHASALQSIRGAGHRQGIWIPPPPIYQPVIAAGGRRRRRAQKLLHVIAPSAVTPLNISAGISRVRGGYWDFCVCKSGANRNIRETTTGSPAGLIRTVNHPCFPRTPCTCCGRVH